MTYRIILIDDEALGPLKEMCELIATEHHIEPFASVEHFVERLKEAHLAFDFALIDENLSEGNSGTKLGLELAERFPYLALVMLTGEGKAPVVKVMSNGFCFFFEKPFDRRRFYMELESSKLFKEATRKKHHYIQGQLRSYFISMPNTLRRLFYDELNAKSIDGFNKSELRIPLENGQYDLPSLMANPLKAEDVSLTIKQIELLLESTQLEYKYTGNFVHNTYKKMLHDYWHLPLKEHMAEKKSIDFHALNYALNLIRIQESIENKAKHGRGECFELSIRNRKHKATSSINSKSFGRDNFRSKLVLRRIVFWYNETTRLPNIDKDELGSLFRDGVLSQDVFPRPTDIFGTNLGIASDLTHDRRFIEEDYIFSEEESWRQMFGKYVESVYMFIDEELDSRLFGRNAIKDLGDLNEFIEKSSTERQRMIITSIRSSWVEAQTKHDDRVIEIINHFVLSDYSD